MAPPCFLNDTRLSCCSCAILYWIRWLHPYRCSMNVVQPSAFCWRLISEVRNCPFWSGITERTGPVSRIMRPRYLTKTFFDSLLLIRTQKYIIVLLLIPVLCLMTTIDWRLPVSERRYCRICISVSESSTWVRTERWTAVIVCLARPGILVSTLPCIQNDKSLSHLPNIRAVRRCTIHWTM